MDLIGVVGQQGKPSIVGFGEGPAQTATVNIADFEILEVASFPALFHGHCANPPPSGTRFRLYSGACRRHAKFCGERDGTLGPLDNRKIDQLTAESNRAVAARNR